jgi:hypothetical protein
MLAAFMSFGVAVGAALLALVVVFLVSYMFALGDLGILLGYVVPVIVGIWAFIVTFRKVTAYISN